MADDKTIRGPQDRKLIALDEDYEVAYWTEKFDVSKDELAAAVKSVGHSADAVERYFESRQRANAESVKAASKMPSP
jgi:hypothetical protein